MGDDHRRPGRGTATSAGAAETTVETTFLDAETAIVAVRGDVGYEVSQQLRRHLYGVVDAGVLRLVVDLGDAAFVSSLALGALLGTVGGCAPAAASCASPARARTSGASSS